ncbi:MAG: hypothetical protein HRT47_11665 [Candidatus Caenarcaniphilales bacterium]|nr:hypothetical protein [Candidatus Caenarcaniphilales bacterium]
MELPPPHHHLPSLTDRIEKKKRQGKDSEVTKPERQVDPKFAKKIAAYNSPLVISKKESNHLDDKSTEAYNRLFEILFKSDFYYELEDPGLNEFLPNSDSITREKNSVSGNGDVTYISWEMLENFINPKVNEQFDIDFSYTKSKQAPNTLKLKINNIWKAQYNETEKIHDRISILENLAELELTGSSNKKVPNKVDKLISILEDTINGGGGGDGGEPIDGELIQLPSKKQKAEIIPLLPKRETG